MKNLKIIIFGFIIGLILFSGLPKQIAQAQHSKVPPGAPFLPVQPPVQPNGACRMDPSIIFTQEQAEKLPHLQRAYLEEVKPLWSELKDLRIELRFAVSDSRVQPEALLDKQRKLSVLQAKLENLFFSYQVKARAIFTKEQLNRFPSDCPLKGGIGHWPGVGKGKGVQRRNR
ncbi:MAG: hypothetical protein H6Q43_1272 [Deltaproteobacteria bacterium]|nr:hypothetical protein [Deltaproteobacteria bacterium]